MEEAGASGQTSWFWFWPCSCFTAKALQLCVPLPPSCKERFIRTRPSLQGAEKCRILLVPLEGTTWACWGPAAATGVRQSPVTAMSGTELPWQGLALGQQGWVMGGILGRISAESAPQVSPVCSGPSKAPLPHCCSDPFKMTPQAFACSWVTHITWWWVWLTTQVFTQTTAHKSLPLKSLFLNT